MKECVGTFNNNYLLSIVFREISLTPLLHRDVAGGGQLCVCARVGASLAALAGEEQQGGAEPAAGGPPPHPGHTQE